MKKKSNNFLTSFFIYFFLIVTIVLIQYSTINAQNIQPVNKQVEKAVLAEDWEKVATLLDSVTPETMSPVLRLIKGHAALAINHNNESLCLFFSVSSEKDLNAWKDWTQRLQSRNPNNEIAHYFSGDALARKKQFEAAINIFNKALKLHKNHPLILNSRGAAYAGNGQWDHALLDFVKASQIAPTLADVNTSLGTIWIQRRAAPQAAVEAFNKALNISPDSVVALNGRACAEFALGHFDKAVNYFERAGAKAKWYPTPVANMVSFASMKDELMLQVGNKKTKIKPGTSIEVITKYVTSLPSEEARFDYIRAKGNLQRNKLFGKISNFLTNFSASIESSGAGGMSDDEQEQLIEDLKKELEWLYEHGLGRSKRAKEIEALIEAYEKWRLGGKPKPGEEGEGDEENQKSRTAEKQPMRPKLVQINPYIIIGGKGGRIIIPGPLDGDEEEEIIRFLNTNKLTKSSKKDELFFNDYIKTLISIHPEAIKISQVKGITAEDLISAHLDKGKWLTTGYGLKYPVRSVKISSKNKQR